MTIPPRWSELQEESFYKAASELCITCIDPRHDQCSITPGCSCCDGDRESIAEQGNHNRFAVNDTANDELYMGEEIGPIAGGLGEVTSSWHMTADALSDSTGAPDNSAPISPTNTKTSPDMNIDPSAAATQPDPNAQMGMAAMASTWTANDYMDTIHKVASDSDVFYQGYDDAVSSKQMDEGLANLSMDYYQGYKQGLLYNKTNLESAPANIEHINYDDHYEMQKSAPGPLDRGELSIMSDEPGFNSISDQGSNYPKA